MAERKIYEWDAVSSGNDFPALDGGWPEGMQRKPVNDASRVDLAALRQWYNDPEWIVVSIQGPEAADIGVFSQLTATTFQISLTGVDLTSYFADGRIIKIIDGVSPGVDLITQVSGTSTYSNPLTSVTIKSTDTMVAASTDAVVHHSSIIRALALLDENAQFFIPATKTAAGINAAIVAATAAGGGTVFLTGGTYNLEAAINLTAATGVVLMGSGPETLMLQEVSAAISPLITIGNVGVNLRNLRIDQNGNPGTILEIDSGIRIRLENLVFVDGDIHIKLTSTTTQNLVIDKCFFTLYDQHAITTNAVSNVHSGQIHACRFQPSTTPNISEPSSIKVSGTWVIDGNFFIAVGHSSNVPRGIWLWNEVTSDGGRRSVISNNSLSSTSTNHVMIEIGGDSVACVGNRLALFGEGKGIWVRGTQAGQTITGVTISGNVIVGGSPIVVNERTLNIAITGNTCNVAAGKVGIDVDGDTGIISGNMIQTGATGILIGINSNEQHVEGNHISDQTSDAIDVLGDLCSVQNNRVTGAQSTCVRVQGTANKARIFDNILSATATIGIEVIGAPTLLQLYRNSVGGSTTGINLGASVVDARLKDNDATGAGTGLVDGGSTGTNRFGNTFDIHMVESISVGGSVTSVPMPCGGGPGLYRVSATIRVVGSGSPNTASCDVHIGPIGTLADPLINRALAGCSGTTGATNDATTIRDYTGGSGDILYSVYEDGTACDATIQKVAMD